VQQHQNAGHVRFINTKTLSQLLPATHNHSSGCGQRHELPLLRHTSSHMQQRVNTWDVSTSCCSDSVVNSTVLRYISDAVT
jgi:hypothetical protein